MSALTVTLGADITALKRAMAGATELVAASARRMGKITGAGLAGLGKSGAVALGKGFEVSGIALKAGIGATGGCPHVVGASVSPQATRLDPIVTSLGKVGGGGYSSGTLDAQRENNRLTGETNRLLTRMDQKLGKHGTGLAAFG